ncbi:hypothetical protein SAY86_017079 [Trapa natans]|uniref:Uncharacterized protein n=1 Tax=Trapa natans TaxID=22666 RepID=A0AAN7M5N2_TRANT|nr:hypothetical protein SAY86_017079 [Trapa natans]
MPQNFPNTCTGLGHQSDPWRSNVGKIGHRFFTCLFPEVSRKNLQSLKQIENPFHYLQSIAYSSSAHSDFGDTARSLR